MPLKPQKIGEGYVELRARMDKLLADMAKAKKGVLKSTKSIGKLGKADLALLAAGFSLAVGAAVVLGRTMNRLVGDAVEVADSIAKTSRSLGIASDAYQELTFVASQSSVTQKEFEVGTKNLLRRVKEADQGMASYQRIFGELNIELRNSKGELKGVDTLLPELADSFAGVANEVDRVGLALQLFGRPGTKFLQILEGGSERMNALRGEAQKLGLVFSQEMLNNAETASDQLDRMSKILKINLQKTLLSLTPVIEKFGAAMAAAAPHVAAFFESIGSPTTLNEVQVRIDKRIAELREISARAGRGLESGNNNNRRDRFGAEMFGIKSELKDLVELREKLQGEATARKDLKTIMDESLQGRRDRLEQIRKEIKLREAQVESIRESQDARAEELRSQKEAFDQSVKLIEESLGDRLDDLKTVVPFKEVKLVGDMIDDIPPRMKEMVDMWDSFRAGASAAFADMIVDGEGSFKQLARSFIKEFLQAAIFKGLGTLFSSALGGTVGASLPISGRAIGGPVQTNTPFMVGERGPEVFVPSGSGTIEPQVGSSVTVNQEMHIAPGMSGQIRQEVIGLRPWLEAVAVSAVNDAKRRGGNFA